MQAPLTPDRIAAAYDFLRQWPPYCRWKLPESDAIRFRTTERRDCEGEFNSQPRLDIMVSTACCWHLDSILMVTAHEMLHLHQHLRGTENRSQHNAEFKRFARQVCQYFGWDFGRFVGGI